MHPHLLFDVAEVEGIRKRVETGRPRLLWNRLLLNCKLYRDPASQYYVDVESHKSDFGKTRVGYFRTLRSASELAFAGLIGGERDSGRRAAQILYSLVQPDVAETTFLALRGKSAASDTVLCQPSLLDAWAIAYDLAASFMTEEEKRAVAAYLLDRVEFSWSRRWSVPAARENRSMLWNAGPAALALALWGDVDHPVLAQYPAYAEPNVEEYLDSAFYSDGSSVEGMSYGMVLGRALLFGEMLSRKNIGTGITDSRPLYKNAVLFWYLTREPGMLAFPIAKAMQPREMVLYPSSMWLLIARRFDVPLARHFWRERFDAMSQSSAQAPFTPDDWTPEIVYNLLYCDDAEKAAGPEELELPASYHFKERGVVVARRDHKEQTPVFRLVAGPLSFPGSITQHWDALSISLSAYGQRLIVDPGYYYARPKGTPGAGFISQTAAHSSLLLDGQGQETLCKGRIWPAAIVWHEREKEFEYAMASAALKSNGVNTDGYGDCTVAERHALVVHEEQTPFYVVICDIFDYPEEKAAREPTLQFVLVSADDTTLAVDNHGATISGPKAQLRAELVTRTRVTTQVEPLVGLPGSVTDGSGVAERNPRIIWGRKGKHGRILTVLTPLKDGMAPPGVELLQDTPERTSCSVRFGSIEDQITFWAPRPEIMENGMLKTGIRLKVVRRREGKETRTFTVPALSSPYIVQ
jgi:hypothetical protein